MTEINGETSAECSALETSAIAQSLERMALAFFDDEGYKSAETATKPVGVSSKTLTK